MKLKLFCLALITFIVGCAAVQTKSYNQYISGSTDTSLMIASEELRDYNQIPFINQRKITVHFYTDEMSCPDLVTREKGYLYSVPLNKVNWTNTVNVPTKGNLFGVIENEWSSGGNVTRCVQSFKINASQNVKYTLDIDVQKTGFSASSKCKFEVRETGTDNVVPVLQPSCDV